MTLFNHIARNVLSGSAGLGLPLTDYEKVQRLTSALEDVLEAIPRRSYWPPELTEAVMKAKSTLEVTR